MTRFIYIYLFLFLIPLSSFSQDNHDFKNFLKVGGDVYTAPFHFDNKDVLNLSLSTAAIVGAYFLDEPVRNLFQRNKGKVGDAIFSVDKYAIEGATVAIAGVYIYGLVADDNTTRNLGLRLIEAYAFSELSNYVIKILSGRSRPFNNLGNDQFNPIQFDFDNTSFPSGHTAMGFSIGKVMADYSKTIAWKVTWYAFGVLMGTARIYNDRHWLSDVVAGGLLSYFISEFVDNHYTNKNVQLGTTGMNFSLKVIL